MIILPLKAAYTIQQVINLLPPRFGTILEEIGYTRDIFGDDKLDEKGDLQDIMLMHIRDCIDPTRNRINELLIWQQIIMQINASMGFEEFETLPAWQEFKKEYPKAGSTLLVWGWS